MSNIQGYIFSVTGEGCGCLSMNVSGDTTSVTCSGWTAAGQICSFEVRTLSQDCGFTSDPVTRIIVLSAPSSPPQLSLDVSDSTCLLQSTNVAVRWTASLRTATAPPVGYQLVVTDGLTMVFNAATTLTNITIPGSVFPKAGIYTFSIRAVNIFGESQATVETMKVASTRVNSTSASTMSSTSLTFVLSSEGCIGADIFVYYQECSSQVNCQCPENDSFSTNEITANITMNPVTVYITNLPSGVYLYCYRSEVRNGGLLVGFDNGRMFMILPPSPPQAIATADLVNVNPPTYRCRNSVEGFNGVSTQAVAAFDATTGVYSIPPCSTFRWLIAVIVILSLTLTSGLVATGVAVTVYCCIKHKSKAPKNPHQSGPVYEQVDDVKPDPHTEGNLAYGHVQHTGRQQSSQPPTELRGQVYEEPENFKPDPHTQGNVAYGQVQFTE